MENKGDTHGPVKWESSKKEEILAALRDDDREALIKLYIPLAYKLAGDDPDKRGEALLAVVEAVGNVMRNDVENIPSYMFNYIRGKVLKTHRRRRPITFTESESDISIIGEYDDEPVFDNIKLDPVERQIVQFRLDGYNMEEIGGFFSKTKQWVSKKLKAIQERFR